MSKSTEIIGSVIEFFSMLSGGFFVALLFDVFRSMRKAVRRNNGRNFTVTVYLQDLLFLLLSFAVLVLLIYRINGGSVDWYIAVGCIAGAFAYYYFAEPIAGKFIFAIFYAVIKVVKMIARSLRKVASKIGLAKKITKITKKCTFFMKKRKKSLKKAGATSTLNI